MRTEATMAYPEGRLLAARNGTVNGTVHVLAPDGWSRLGASTPPHAEPLSRQDAEDWCERQGWELDLLDRVPR